MVGQVDFNDTEIPQVDGQDFEDWQQLVQIDKSFVLKVDQLEENWSLLLTLYFVFDSKTPKQAADAGEFFSIHNFITIQVEDPEQITEQVQIVWDAHALHCIEELRFVEVTLHQARLPRKQPSCSRSWHES